MIADNEMSWLKEYLLARSQTDADIETMNDIVDTFRKLWFVAKAGENYRDRRSNESLSLFCEMLEALKKPKGDNMKRTLAVILLCAAIAQASEIQWTRLIGTVKAPNAKTQMLTIEDSAGDLLSIHIDGDIDVFKGKERVAKLSDLKLGDKVTLLYNPKAPAPKDAEEPRAGGVYDPVKR